MTQPDRYIVTGGAGFIGSNLVADLLRRDPGADVLVIDDLRSGTFENLVDQCTRAGVGPFRGAFLAGRAGERDWPALLAHRRPRAVFHLGAITDTTVSDEAEMIRVNAGEFEPMLAACVDAGVPLVYASSAATYGTPDEAGRREAFPVEAAGRPNNVYGFSKWLMECAHARIDRDRRDRAGSRPWVVGLRYFNVFGPGERAKGKMASMVLQLASRMLRAERPRLFADGEQARDQVYVDDVVACTLAGAGLGDRPDPEPGVYNLGSGKPTTFNEIVDALREGLRIAEAELPTEYFEMPAHIRAFYQDFTLADMEATARGLGWRPARAPRDGIIAYARHLASEGRPASDGSPA